MLVFHDLLMVAQVKEYEDVQINFNVNFKGALTFGEIEVIMDSWNQMQEQRKEIEIVKRTEAFCVERMRKNGTLPKNNPFDDQYETDPIHGKDKNT